MAHNGYHFSDWGNRGGWERGAGKTGWHSSIGCAIIRHMDFFNKNKKLLLAALALIVSGFAAMSPVGQEIKSAICAPSVSGLEQ